jgi:hypothetical protein
MEPIKIISNVDDEGKLYIPEGLSFKKGRVEITIKPLDDANDKRVPLSYSDHYWVLVESLRREDIYGKD